MNNNFNLNEYYKNRDHNLLIENGEILEENKLYFTKDHGVCYHVGRECRKLGEYDSQETAKEHADEYQAGSEDNHPPYANTIKSLIMWSQDYRNSNSRNHLLNRLENETRLKESIYTCYAIAGLIKCNRREKSVYYFCTKIRSLAQKSDAIARKVNLIISLLLLKEENEEELEISRLRFASSPLGNDQLLDLLEANYDSFYDVDEALQLIHPLSQEQINEMNEELSFYYSESWLPNRIPSDSPNV